MSEQVRKMLIKSRATGLQKIDKNIQLHDRVYLHCILWYDNHHSKDIEVDKNTPNDTPSLSNNDETFIYVSIQDTIGRVVDHFLPNKSLPQQFAFAKEMLLPRIRIASGQQDGHEYQRLASTSRFYEAIERQLILKSNINTVIIRFFNPNEQDATPLLDFVTTINPDVSIGAANVDSVPTTFTTDEAIDSMNGDVEIHERNTTTESTAILFPTVAGGTYKQLWDTVSKHLVTTSNSDPKRISAKEKVRQMQMKSKAIGDTKRIQRMEHRLFLQLISVVLNRTTNAMQVNGNTPIFVSRYDNVQRLVSDQTLQKNGTTAWELLIPIFSKSTTACAIDCDTTSSDHKFRLVASSVNQKNSKVTWEDLIHQEKVNCFGIVLLLNFTL